MAARAAVFAKAAAYCGAVLAGWYAAQGLNLLPDLIGNRLARLLVAIAATLAAIGLSVAGFIVQRWCRVPPPSDDEDPSESDRQ
jgi:hypothetical protein